jgi:hypothetical protein
VLVVTATSPPVVATVAPTEAGIVLVTPAAPGGASPQPSGTPTEAGIVLVTPAAPGGPSATKPKPAGPTNTPKPPVATGPVGILAYTVVEPPGGNFVPEAHSIWVAGADGSDAHQVLKKARWPALTPTGKQILFYSMNASLDYYNFDGSPRQTFIGEQFSFGAAQSPDTQWVAITVNPGRAVAGNFFIDLVTNKAQNRHKLIEGFKFSWAPDSTRVAYDGCAPGGNPCGIFVIPIGGGTPQLLTGEAAGGPSWKGNRIAFHKDVNGVKQIFVMNADGSNVKQLTSGATIHTSPSWDRTGNFIFYRSPESGAWGIWVMRADGTGQRQVIPNVGVDDLWYTEPVSVY